jgi:hypothetical protein
MRNFTADTIVALAGLKGRDERFFRVLFKNVGKPLSGYELIYLAYEDDGGADHFTPSYLDVLASSTVRRLRRSLPGAFKITCHYGKGYVLEMSDVS